MLDPNKDAPRYTHLNHIMDFGRWKYGDPLLSSDGQKIYQIGSVDLAGRGVGQGVVLITLPPYQ
ncbi:MAG: hypothetical protein JWP15_2208 [Alphaproteobacteria bacterium]|nr:hypothetical protein [Alphaproteobacteria bacterium]